MAIRLVSGVVLHFALVLSLGELGCADRTCKTSPQGNEVCIKAGAFVMGADKLARPKVDSNECRAMPANDWVPSHFVEFKKPYWIDAYEVTNGEYAACVAAGICTNRDFQAYDLAVLADPRRATLPVTGASYEQATAYCLWRHKRLPTEAEWERAARGPESFQYPWGNQPPTIATLRAQGASFCCGRPPAIGGTNKEDVSVEGVHDMFGNAAEWTADWYSPRWYSQTEATTAQGPPSPVHFEERHEYGGCEIVSARGERVIRGSHSWAAGDDRDFDYSTLGRPSWLREAAASTAAAGFRCARDDRELTEPSSEVPRYEGLRWRAVRKVGGR